MTATSTDPTWLARERLAGYDPTALGSARIVVIGAGALGQNAVLALALSGVRTLVVVDPDTFEASNRTRSPFYKMDAPKAQAVAEGFLRTATHPEAQAFFHAGMVQEVGDLVTGGLEKSWFPTAIVSAVDSNQGRAYLAQLCRRFAVPLVEAGFDGADIGVCVVSNHREIVGEPCWACGRRNIRDASTRGLCSLYARQAEDAGDVPAIQSAAQIAGALVAEAAIGFAHVRTGGDDDAEFALRQRVPLAGHRWHLNLRTGRSVLARLALDSDCAVDHRHLEPADLLGVVEPTTTVGDLFTSLAVLLPEPEALLLPEFIAVSLPCRLCGRALSVGLPLSAVSLAPACPAGTCGQPGAPAVPIVRQMLEAGDEEVAALPLRAVGLGPGSVFHVSGRGCAGLVQLAGTVPGVFPRAVHPNPLESTP